MLRVAATRCARSAVRASVVPPRIALRTQQFVRYKSDDVLKPLLKERDRLQADWDAPKLTYEQVKPKTEQPSPNFYVIDVREPDEVLQGSIPSSVNLPLSSIGKAFTLEPSDFKAKYGFKKPEKDQEMIFYCRSGKRSATASDVAKRNGFTNIFNYEGSWLDWVQREGKPGSS